MTEMNEQLSIQGIDEKKLEDSMTGMSINAYEKSQSRIARDPYTFASSAQGHSLYYFP